MNTEDAEMSDVETMPPTDPPAPIIPARATFIQLANLATAHGDSPKIWVDALIQLFAEAAQNDQLVLEALHKTREKLKDASLAELAKTNIGRLLRVVRALEGHHLLRQSLLWTLAARSSSLSLAHVLLGTLTTPDSARFLSAFPLGLPLEFDPSLGRFEGRELSAYFEHAADVFFALRRYDEAAVHAKCALSTCTVRAPLGDLANKVVAYELVASRRPANALPSFLSEALSLEPLAPQARQVLAVFADVAKVAQPAGDHFAAVAAAIDTFCRHAHLDAAAQPLKDAYQVAWLVVTHAVMPRVPLAIAEQSGPTPPLELLLRANYPAALDGNVFILRRPGQWNTLERCLQVVQRLPETKRIANLPRAAPEFYEDDIVF